MVGFGWKQKPAAYAKVYDHLDETYHHFYSKSAARLCQLARLQPGQTVIDLGCGTGTSTAVFWKAISPSGHLFAIDPSEAMLSCAREKLSQNKRIQWMCEDGYNILSLCQQLNLLGKIDCVLSSWTYYYLYEDREQLHRDIHTLLRPGGKWAFNITTCTSPIECGGETYNQFSRIYDFTLNRVLREKGYQPDAGRTTYDPQFHSPEPNRIMLSRVGFASVETEAWPLPLSPSEAHAFLLEGFVRHGAKPVFSKTLESLSIPKRVQLLEETLSSCSNELNATGEVPHILNVWAVK